MLLIDLENAQVADVPADEKVDKTFVCDKCKKEIHDKGRLITTFFKLENVDDVQLCRKCKRDFEKFCEKPITEYSQKLLREFIGEKK